VRTASIIRDDENLKSHIIIGNSERKKQLGRPVPEWEDDIKM
jgi:hypothetical protein